MKNIINSKGVETKIFANTFDIDILKPLYNFKAS